MLFTSFFCPNILLYSLFFFALCFPSLVQLIPNCLPSQQHCYKTFGAERCMYGSDWPVCALASTYVSVKQLVEQCLVGQSAESKARVFGGTAIDFYRLRLPDH